LCLKTELSVRTRIFVIPHRLIERPSNDKSILYYASILVLSALSKNAELLQHSFVA